MNWLTNLANLDWSPILWGGLWAGLVALILGLTFLLWTRWGYYHLIGKCVLFSVLAHLVLGLFFATAEVVEAVGPLLPAGLSSPITIEEVRISTDSESNTEGAGIAAAPDPVREWDRPRNTVMIKPAPLESTARELPTPPAAERPAQTEDELPRQSPRPELPVAEKQPDQPRLAQSTPDAPDRAHSLTTPQQPLAQATEQPKGAVPQSTAIPMTPQFGIGSAPSPRRMTSADALPRDNALVATIARTAPIADRGSLALPDLPVAAMLPARPVEASVAETTKPGATARQPIATPDLIASTARPKQPEPRTKPPEPVTNLRAGYGLPGGAKEAAAPTRASRSDVDAVPLPAPRAGTDASLSASEAFTPIPVRAIGPGGPAGDRAGMRLGTAEIYRNRISPNRSDLAILRGGSRASEQAVERALEWFVAHQHSDGHWDADGFMIHCPKDSPCTGPGRQNRDDGAVTGLVLLAFLGAGQTHQAGSYAEQVSRAIDWLLAQQKPNGDLRGPGRMYSQGIATLALSEALGMTGDPRLRNPVDRAVRFIVAAQHATSGGWRYDPGNYGDTSVFGWQLMALKSAALAGVAVPDSTWQKARGWLSIVGSGRSRGLASYLPGEAVTPAMTAEALACREFLGASAGDPAAREAAEYIMKYLPHRERQNLYYWYYGTVALFQIGGPQWEAWNAALRDLLIGQQRRDGHAAGSWEPRGDPWGNEGGRVYTTALSTLCLEVYYRYLPLQSIGADETHETTPLPSQSANPDQ